MIVALFGGDLGLRVRAGPSINAFVVRLFIKFSLTAHGAAVAWLFHRVPIPRLKPEITTYGEHASYWRTHGETALYILWYKLFS